MKYYLGYWSLKLIMKWIPEETSNRIIEDVLHKQEIMYSHKLLVEHMRNRLPFRNVFYWRIDNERKKGNITFITVLLEKFLQIMFPALSTIEISISSGELGGDFYLPHSYCVINAEKIGSHVSILQGVTIGKDHKGKRPDIGNSVVIYPNSVITGGIKVGDHVYIGANSFVNFDVENWGTVRTMKASVSKYDKLNN